MVSVLMMAAANLKKKRAQSALIGITIFMAALLLATAVGILGNISDPFARMFEQQNGSQVTMLLEGQVHDAASTAAWWEKAEAVDSVSVLPYVQMGEEFLHNDTVRSLGGILLTEHPGHPPVQDRLVIVEGNEKAVPEGNELWVPTGFAYAWGIKPGDTLGLPVNGSYYEMQVGAIVVDPQFSAALMSPVRVWAAAGTLADLLTEAVKTDTMIGLRFNDYTQYDQLWGEFESYLGTPFFGFVFEYEFVRNMYSMVQTILGAIMLLFALLIILVSVFVIGFTITNSVLADYKVIGILKAQGFSAAQVKRIYSLQYLLLAAFAVPPGILAGNYVAGAVMSRMAKSLGIARLDSSLLLSGLLTITVLFAATLIASSASAGKAGRIKPADAIRNASFAGRSDAGKSINLTRLSALPVSVMLSLKNMMSGKRLSLFMGAAVSVMAFVLVFSVNTYHSVKNMDKNYAWWGFDAADAFVFPVDARVEAEQELAERLYADERVEAVVPNSVTLSAAIPAQSGLNSTNVLAFIYGGNMDSIGMVNLQGTNPLQRDEVSVSYLVAEKYGKDVGDRIDLYLEGEKESYLITGIYQSLSGMGWSIRIQEAAYRVGNPSFVADSYSVKLKDGYDVGVFAGDMKRMLGDGYTVLTTDEINYFNLSEITGNMALATLFISAVFMGVSFIIVFNITLMGIYSDRTSFGIYKALGMTPVQVRLSMVWKAVFLSVSGIMLGVPLALFISPLLISMLLANMGLAQFPFMVTLWGTLAAIPLCLVVTILSSWIPSGKILAINPRNLIVD